MRTAADATAMLVAWRARGKTSACRRRRPRVAAVAAGARRAGGDGARLRRAPGADARLDVRRRPRRGLVRRRLPPRDLPAGGGDARRTGPVPVARLGSDRRPELHLAADGGVLPRAADAAAARRGGRRDGRPRPGRASRSRSGSSASATGGSTASSALWPQVAGEMRVSHLTPLLCAPRGARVAHAARAARARARGRRRGRDEVLRLAARALARRSAVATRRRSSPSRSARASLLLVLPFTPLDEYVRVLLQPRAGLRPGRVHDLRPRRPGRRPGARRPDRDLAAGAALLAATWRYRSFTLALAAALVLSPIVWLDYFAVALVPLAIVRPRLSLVWFLPLATWGLQGAGIGIGDPTASAGADRLPGRLRRRVPRRARAQRSPTAPVASWSPARLAMKAAPCASGRWSPSACSPSSSRSAMLVVGAPGSLAVDFHHELYPRGGARPRRREPVPARGPDLSGGRNFIWPPLAAFLVVPLTASCPSRPPTARSPSSASRARWRRSGSSASGIGASTGRSRCGRR